MFWFDGLEWPGSPAGHRGILNKNGFCEMCLRPLAEQQRWTESFEAGLKALGASSPAVPVRTLQDILEGFLPGTTGVKSNLIAVSRDVLKTTDLALSPTREHNAVQKSNHRQ